MKKLSKALALILCLAMLFVMCACGENDTEKFVGTWEAEVDMTDTALASLEDELGDLMVYFDFGKIISVITFTFDADGTYEMTMKLTDESVEGYNSALKDGLKAMMSDQLAAEMEAYGMTQEEYEAAYIEAYGVTVDEDIDAYIEQAIQEIDIQQILADSSMEGNWKVQDGKLFMTEDVDDDFDEASYDVYEALTDTGFTIVSEFNEGEEDTENDLYPINFTKVG